MCSAAWCRCAALYGLCAQLTHAPVPGCGAVPSLVSIPLLGFRDYDRQVYATTRKRLLSSTTNRFYFEGQEFKVSRATRRFGGRGRHVALALGQLGLACRKHAGLCWGPMLLQGMGSPHTSSGMAWALGIFSEVRSPPACICCACAACPVPHRFLNLCTAQDAVSKRHRH